ncbi:ferrous iron transporter B [Pelotomaculum terephthalicicum JT]|uniref:nucleoside recognition domain-containing protein n=1 Tax=Pelotomaculum terephthalicicum TaxID=206393 RepID=UPI0009C64E40|nr:nucleoside recognition domain-containing protein [Pelotomaculum terephthalicicum]MCG9966763.1 ferrous iron transporter B [Pelotomaculum terephthalicicum JT]OPY60092.1 MAG: Ferrous iron transport protein B [Pelotomaculum sp. PtaU1.Bin065]
MSRGSLSADLNELMQEVNRLNPGSSLKLNDSIVCTIYSRAEEITGGIVLRRGKPKFDWDKKLDDVITSRVFGFPSMLLLLAVIFWITVAGANIPSEMMATAFFWGQERLTALLHWLHAPAWVNGFFVEGIYRCLAWVVSVMLPPMAIFFPCFTLLEDMGYLPRIAFNLDNLFKKAGTHGKQSLTMSMGFGCNAAGVIACRIIESPRERLIAMLTNNFVPCNGRFPTLIALAGLLVMGMATSLSASFIVVGVVLTGIMTTLVVSWLLSKTLLKGVPSSFTLELPPYRKPQLGRIITRSIFDRTLFVLRRAVLVAAPAGAVIWLLANVHIGGVSILAHGANWLHPFGQLLGMDGYILMAFLLGLPANEIVIPILLMSYMATGTMIELDSLEALRQLFVAEHGWTWLTAVCMMLFSLLHYPCGTTLWTIFKESGSLKWTALAALIPLGIAVIVCFVLAQSARLLGWV